jgi:hypothetical protein
MNPYGLHFHEAVYMTANQQAAELVTVEGHVFCQATSRNDSFVSWLVLHRGQYIDVEFTTR